MKKLYYIAVDKKDELGFHFEPVENARPLILVDWLETFYHRQDNGLYVISEARTGTKISVSLTKKVAVERAKAILAEKTKEETLQAVENKIKEHGEVPKSYPQVAIDSENTPPIIK